MSDQTPPQDALDAERDEDQPQPSPDAAAQGDTSEPSTGPEPPDFDEPDGGEQRTIDATEGPPELVSQLALAMSEAGTVHKDRTNTDQGWKFASVESMLAAVRGPLLARGIVLSAQPTGWRCEEIRSRSGTPGEKVTVTFDFTFRGLGGEFTVYGWEGDGTDYADKAKGKAITNAIKTFIRAQWLLPTELDDDPDRNTPEARAARDTPAELPAWARPATPEQRKELGDALTTIIGAERARALGAGTRQSFGHVPGCVVGFGKALIAHLEAHRQDQDAEQPDSAGPAAVDVGSDGLSGALAQAAEQARAAEPDVPVDTDGLIEPEPEPDPDALTRQAERAKLPPAGTIDIDAKTDELRQQLDGYIDALPEDDALVRGVAIELCTCPQGLDTPADQRDDTCPLLGHGIPF